jgi:hypothetical protein
VSVAGLQGLLQRILFLFGVGFFVANVLAVMDLLRYSIRRRSALLVWQAEKPKFYKVSFALAFALAALFVLKRFVYNRPMEQLLGETMMLLYYGIAFPLTTRIERGFYSDGVWSDSGFMKWAQISAVSWRDEGAKTLILISKFRQIARRLKIPGDLYDQARRLLRVQVNKHALHIGGTGLDLGSRDEADAV